MLLGCGYDGFRALMYVILAMMLHDSGETQPSVEEDGVEDDDDYIDWADDMGPGVDEDDDEDEEAACEGVEASDPAEAARPQRQQ